MTTHEFSRSAEIEAALANVDLIPPPVERGPHGSMAWLRASVSRFASGPVHARRRALIEADLARLDPTALRSAIAGSAPAPTSHDDLRRLVVRTLAQALALTEPDAIATAVMTMAGTYFGGEDPAADEAAAWLLGHLGEADEEVAANRICLLVQACDATAALVGNARRSVMDEDVDAWLARTLRDDPPAPVLRRVAARDTHVNGTAIAHGDEVLLDIAAANLERDPYLSFGSGLRPCPAGAHALALAAGLLER